MLVTSRQRLAALAEAADVPPGDPEPAERPPTLLARLAAPARAAGRRSRRSAGLARHRAGTCRSTIAVAGQPPADSIPPGPVAGLAAELALDRGDGGLGPDARGDRVGRRCVRPVVPGPRPGHRGGCSARLGLVSGLRASTPTPRPPWPGWIRAAAQTLLDAAVRLPPRSKNQPRGGATRLHDLIREHARAVAAAEDPAGPSAWRPGRRLLAYYLQMALAARPHRHLARRTPSGLPRHRPAEVRRRTPRGVHDPQASGSGGWTPSDLNLHAAADHAAASGLPEYAIAIPVAMTSYLYRRGHWRQGLDLSRLAQEAARELGDDLSAARILTDIGWLQYMLADMRAARASLTEALALYGGLADPVGQGHALSHLGAADHSTGDYDAAAGNWLAARTLYQRAGDTRGEAEVTHRLGIVQMGVGDHQAAVASQEAALAAYVALGDTIGQANVLAYLGHLHGAQGRYDDGIAEITRAETLFREAEDHWNVAGLPLLPRLGRGGGRGHRRGGGRPEPRAGDVRRRRRRVRRGGRQGTSWACCRPRPGTMPTRPRTWPARPRSTTATRARTASPWSTTARVSSRWRWTIPPPRSPIIRPPSRSRSDAA